MEQIIRKIDDYISKEVEKLKHENDELLRIKVCYFNDGEAIDFGMELCFVDEESDDYHIHYVSLYNDLELKKSLDLVVKTQEKFNQLIESLVDSLKRSEWVSKESLILVEETD